MRTEKLSDLRQNYGQYELTKAEVAKSPFDQFQVWMDQALEVIKLEANAMVLSTVDVKGKPSSRVVLLKGIDADGYLFYTNYNSRKGKELQLNPSANLLFFWKEMERQVRIEGTVKRVDEEVSRQYFQSRPIGSQIGATASPQSEVISREELQAKVNELERQYTDASELPLPDYWGGYKLYPDYFEFWQGRPNRLHDRICYTQQGDQWKIERLAP